ncbi:MAG TPA: ABC transporter substrate-binding protein [Rhodospirillaceae bacterium]|nr:ABC transporter substrate-binding protein [Rhodospirillaceae bacterium]
MFRAITLTATEERHSPGRGITGIIALKRLLATLLFAGLMGHNAAAEVSEVRFARMQGLGYLQLYLLDDLKLVEKHSRDSGDAITSRVIPLNQPTAVIDALLSGGADFGVAGITPFITLWDKTLGNLNVRALAALNSQPAFLNSSNPNVKSIRDFTESDRIALPAVKVAYQATILQMAAEQAFGRYDRLDTQTVGLAHPDAAAALLSGKSEITAHFTSPPFQYQELADPRIHKVLSSYDVTGGPATFSGIFSTRKFHDENPRAVRAVLAALQEANDIIRAEPHRAAEIYVRLDHARQSVEEVEALLKDPDIQYTITPQNITKYTDFMARVGTIGKRPETWKDLFFPEIYALPGT